MTIAIKELWLANGTARKFAFEVIEVQSLYLNVYDEAARVEDPSEPSHSKFIKRGAIALYACNTE